MSGPPDTSTVPDALIAMLEAATGRPWGDGEAPGGNEHPQLPYGVVFGMPGLPATGDAAAPASEITQVYQLRSVGKTRWQAEALAAKARSAMLDRHPGIGEFVWPIRVDERTRVRLREHDSVLGHDPEGPFHSFDDRFALTIEPA